MKFLTILLVITGVLGGELTKDYAQFNNHFSLDFFEKLVKGPSKNFVFSAFSQETILGLLSLGARGNSAAELKKVLHLPSSDDQIKSEFNNIYSELEQVQHVQISTANQIYLADGFKVEDEFLKTATDVFRAGVQNINFKNSEKAVAEINEWVEGKTNNKIKNLITKEQISDITRMVLVNALYFKGFWQNPFKHDNTEKRDFHTSKTETVQVDTMKLSANLFVHKMDKYNITFIRMPFAGSQNKATLSIAFPHSLDDLDHAYENLRSGAVELNYTRESIKLFLPKFRIESSIDLQPILKDLGISEIFDKPDLSGVTKEPVKVDSVTQNVYIDVHERGAEAAVSTTALLSGRILSTSKAITTEYHVDRPFFFCVQYDEVVLLAGRVINPLLR